VDSGSFPNPLAVAMYLNTQGASIEYSGAFGSCSGAALQFPENDPCMCLSYAAMCQGRLP
jgi:hypothetical protein